MYFYVVRAELKIPAYFPDEPNMQIVGIYNNHDAALHRVEELGEYGTVPDGWEVSEFIIEFWVDGTTHPESRGERYDSGGKRIIYDYHGVRIVE